MKRAISLIMCYVFGWIGLAWYLSHYQDSLPYQDFLPFLMIAFVIFIAYKLFILVPKSDRITINAISLISWPLFYLASGSIRSGQGQLLDIIFIITVIIIPFSALSSYFIYRILKNNAFQQYIEDV